MTDDERRARIKELYGEYETAALAARLLDLTEGSTAFGDRMAKIVQEILDLKGTITFHDGGIK